jgi:hypothetical protein
MAQGADLKEFRSWAAVYFALQGVLVAAWWAWLLLIPSAEMLFWAAETPRAVIVSFLLPDAILLVAASLAAAAGLRASRVWAYSVVCVVSGAAAYSFLWTLSFAFQSGGGGLGAWLMAPAALISAGFAWRLRPH